jgi:hypothetical protein
MLDLQGLTDDLCEKLGRSIAVDNQHVEVIAASAQTGHIDSVRSDAILNRRTRPDIVDYVRSLKIAQATNPRLVPPHPELHTLPRWCFPLRHGVRLLGFLWIINEPELTAEEFALARDYAERIQALLTRNAEQADAILSGSVQMATDLLRNGDRDALERAGRSGMLVTRGQATVWSLELAGEKGAHTAVTTADIFDLLSDLTSTARPGSFIGAPIEDRLVIIARTSSTDHNHQALLTAVRLSCRRQKLLLQAAGGANLTGDPKEALERANFTAIVGKWDGNGEVRRWESLGLWNLLQGRHWSAELVESISPAAFNLTLLTKPDLWQTLLEYLENGSDVQATCEALHIHRATLYYRLGRIKETTGETLLGSGWEQASAHLALRLWRALQRAVAADETDSIP